MKKENETAGSESRKSPADKLTLDQLQTIAVTFCPELYKRNPAEGAKLVKKFLDEGDQEAWRIALKVELPQLDNEWREQEVQWLAKLHFDYEEGVKLITGRKLYRAKERFEQFMLATHPTKSKANTALSRFEKDGFTGTEAKQLRAELAEWWPNRNKGTQGNVRNRDDDGRIRPRPAAIPELKSYLGGIARDES